MSSPEPASLSHLGLRGKRSRYLVAAILVAVTLLDRARPTYRFSSAEQLLFLRAPVRVLIRE